ncbi:Alpha-galactosidase [Lacticaseibacillus rhamnosus R0011]|nr:Alpha-galactosidase [Lacticaseibacillus rhamnosus R0011]
MDVASIIVAFAILVTRMAKAYAIITRSPAQKSACKDLGRNGQERAITPKAAYTPTSNRAGSRSLIKKANRRG